MTGDRTNRHDGDYRPNEEEIDLESIKNIDSYLLTCCNSLRKTIAFQPPLARNASLPTPNGPHTFVFTLPIPLPAFTTPHSILPLPFSYLLLPASPSDSTPHIALLISLLALPSSRDFALSPCLSPSLSAPSISRSSPLSPPPYSHAPSASSFPAPPASLLHWPPILFLLSHPPPRIFLLAVPTRPGQPHRSLLLPSPLFSFPSASSPLYSVFSRFPPCPSLLCRTLTSRHVPVVNSPPFRVFASSSCYMFVFHPILCPSLPPAPLTPLPPLDRLPIDSQVVR